MSSKPEPADLFQIFQAALAKEPHELAEFLECECQDEEQREMVRALLQADAANREAPPRLAIEGGTDLEGLVARLQRGEAWPLIRRKRRSGERVSVLFNSSSNWVEVPWESSTSPCRTAQISLSR
ncbi:MAG: hypothetical protein ACI9F9_002680 [Candidatus Paceibacteria bacterium]|jgi:hypothetical protein